MDAADRATKSPVRIPVVLSRAEVARLLEQVEPTFAVMVALLYGAGLRLMECLRLRVKDVDFDRKMLIVRDAHRLSSECDRAEPDTSCSARGAGAPGTVRVHGARGRSSRT